MDDHQEDLALNFSKHMGISKRFAAHILLYFSLAELSREECLEVLAQAGISDAALDDPGFPISFEQELAASLLMMRREQADVSPAVFGFRYGEEAQLANFGIVGLAAQTAPNLFEGIEIATQFPELLWGTVRVGVHIDEGQTIVSSQFDRPQGIALEDNLIGILEDRILAANVFIWDRYIRDLSDGLCKPSLIALPMAEPPDWHLVADKVDIAVRFDADEATIVYDVDLRDAPTKNPHPTLHQLYVGQAETLANMLREDLPVKERVMRILWTISPPPGRDEVAKKLGLSVRSLSRNLQAEGTSFKELFSDIQLRRAKIMLQDTDMNAATIAFKLGFNDPASFSRSFKAQTGKTPKWAKYRKWGGEMVFTFVRNSFWALTLAAMAGFALPAAAQDSDGEADASEAPDPRGSMAARLDEIVVTAQKREEALQDVPVSVVSVGVEEIEERGLETLEDITKAVPNVSTNSTNLVTHFYVRGIGSGSEGSFEQSIVIVLDGVPTNNFNVVTSMFLDMQRMELLRGPQGTLFGKNTVAGVFNIVTADPHNEWEVKANVQAGDLNSRRYEGVVNIPVIEDVLAIRLLGGYTERDGYMYNTFQQEDDGSFESKSLALKAGLELGDFNFRLAAGYNHSEYPTGYGYQATEFPDEFAIYATSADPTFEDEPDHQSSKDLDEYTFAEIANVSLKTDWNINQSNYILSLILGHVETLDYYVLYDADYSPAYIIDFRIEPTGPVYNSFAELKLTTPPEALFNNRFDFVAGVFYGQDEKSGYVPVAIGTIPCIPGVDLTPICPGPGGGAAAAERIDIYHHVGVESIGVYGQGTYALLDDLDLIAGLRYSTVETTAIDIENQVFTGPLNVPGALATAGGFGNRQGIRESRTDSAVDYKVSARYYLNDDVMLFVTTATGFKAGGYATTVQEDNTTISYEPEESVTYEAGAKAAFFDGIARVNITGFRTDYENLQILTFDGLQQITSNGGTARTQGLEIESQVLLPFNIFASLNGSWLDAHYVENSKAVCYVGDTENVQDDGNPLTTDTCDYSGRRLAYSPEYSFSALLAGEWQLWNLPAMLTAGFDAIWQDDVLFQADTDPEDSQPAYWLFNARLGLRDPDHRWRLTFFVDNMMDETYLVYSNDMPIIAGAHWGSVASPRLYSVALAVHF
ncbi:irgA [Symbiodinium microadriaticum]|nr:irgA [Symbiodinium microadriaticum]